MEIICFTWEQILSFKSKPLIRWDWFTGEQTLSPLSEMVEKLPSVSIYLFFFLFVQKNRALLFQAILCLTS